MKMTRILRKGLFFLCFVFLGTFGYVAESSGQLIIAVPYLATDLPTDWRPTAGSSLSFRVKVTKPAHYSGGSLIATLSEVTNYPGECGNRFSSYNDLELRQSSFRNGGWRAGTSRKSLTHPIGRNRTNSPKSEWMTLEVSCEDYGAYGKLTFSTGGSSIPEALPVVIVIPRDINKNKIADCWRNDVTKSYVASADVDTARMNTELGDNMTVLDEYRGFYRNGTWTDTDPEAWDVFIRLADGLSSAGSLPGMTSHYMGPNEVTHDGGKVLDYQASSLSVYAIRLQSNLDAFDYKNPGKRWGYMGWGPPSSGTAGIFIPSVLG